MITLKLTDGDASLIMTALRNTVDYWSAQHAAAKGTSTPLLQLAREQRDSWAATLVRFEEAYDQAED